MSDVQKSVDAFRQALASAAVRTRIHRAMTYAVRGQFRVMREGRLDWRGRRLHPLAPMTRRQRVARGKPVSDQHPELLSLWDAFIRPSRHAVLSWGPQRGRIGTTSDIYPYHHTGGPRLPQRRLLGVMERPYDTMQHVRDVAAAMLAQEAEAAGLAMSTYPDAESALEEAERESTR